MQTNALRVRDTDVGNYDRWAPVYDLFFGPVFQRGRRVAVDAAERVGGRILEVGIGTGISLSDYSRNSRIVGVDISSPMLEKAKDRVEKLGLRHVEDLAVMDASDLTFDDDSFDVVVAQYVVSTVPKPEATLDEFARVVKPGGEIILLSRVSEETGLRRSIARDRTDRAPADAAVRTFLDDPVQEAKRRRSSCGGHAGRCQRAP
jgi:phosphatidylethanolamine/phosphatidyl-N-methylethanolamine N-methyltransferase